MKKKKCEYCGEEYKVKPSNAKKSKFCSIKCRGLSKRKRIKKKCSWCGEEFELIYSLKERKFCSQKCDYFHRKGLKKPNHAKFMRKRYYNLLKNNELILTFLGRKHKDKTIQLMIKNHKGMLGKKHSKETMKKLNGRIPPHKGKTKETYEPLKRMAKNISKTRLRLFKEGKLKPNKTCFKKGDPRISGEKGKKARAKLILPIKDTKIELKIQDFLTLLKIEFFTHKYMNIKHAYQCDILIPIQIGIPQKTIIECDGDFFHMNPNIYPSDYIIFPNSKHPKTAKEKWELDDARTKELIEKGFRVIRLWENEIKVMELNDFKNKLIKDAN